MEFTHDTLTLKYKLDNEFELVFVVSDLIRLMLVVRITISTQIDTNRYRFSETE